MSFSLPDLPYEVCALEPYISQKTLDYHHKKHHQAYVNTLNQLIEGTPFANQSLIQIIKNCSTSVQEGHRPIFNNAAQVWNHTFYWNSLRHPSASMGILPSGPLEAALNQSFGNLETFQAQFRQAALTQFGSGWVWLVLNVDGVLEVIKTSNADMPLIKGHHPLVVCDVWEHAYYLDYQNRRAEYVDAFLQHMINWSFAEENFQKIPS